MSSFEARLDAVKIMDDIVRNFNNEDLIMTWLTLGCPDESTEEDYEWFAEDEQEFEELGKLFEKLYEKEKKGA